MPQVKLPKAHRKRIHQYWKLTKGGDVSVMDLECDTARALAIHGTFTKAGYAIENIDLDTFLELEKQIDEAP